MTGTPLWIPITQLFMTFFLGLGAGAIAFMQWRTSHMKVVLDLLEKRQQMLFDVEVLTMSYYLNNMDQKDLFRARINCKYLFGPDLSGRIEEHLRLAYDSEFDGSPEMRQEINFRLFTIFRLATPYMAMSQKVVRSPGEWFRDRNALRKSYGDDATTGPEGPVI